MHGLLDIFHEHLMSDEERAAIAQYIWNQENVELSTIGIDIGSSTSHLLFAKVLLQRQSMAAARQGKGLEIDAALTAGGANAALVESLERAGPFGTGNPEPVLAFPLHKIIDVGVVGTDHVRLIAMAGDGARLPAIAFRAAQSPLGRKLLASRGDSLHLAGTLAADRHNGASRPQLRLLDAAEPRERIR